jgi:hypothetical protein
MTSTFWCAYYVMPTEKINAYGALVGKPEGRRPLRRPRHRWEDNIKMDTHRMKWYGMDRSGSG